MSILRAGSRLGFMREMRDASGEATRRAAKPREREREPARRL